MKKAIYNRVLTVFFAASSVYAAQAVPAYPGIIKATQPDGTMVEIVQHGDEHFSWASTPDGYTLLRSDDGFWSFARTDDYGNLVPSAIKYIGSSQEALSAGIAKGLSFSGSQASELASRRKAAQRVSSSQTQIDGTFPSKGKCKLLLLLINYGDTEPRFSQEDFTSFMNQEGYNGKGSFRDYYLENSYGQLDIATTVSRWVTLPSPKNYYGSDGAIEMIRAALTELDDEIDLNDFDNDGDGVLDGLAVIHQGAGQEYSGNAYDIWSHSSVIYGMEFDGVQVRRYTIEPELLGETTNMSTIGVVCHEFGHNLGAPDFYDTDYSQSGGEYPGTGRWDLMGSGAWNGNMGDRPAGTNMWQKIQLGWVEPVKLTATTSISGMKAAHANAEAYRFDTTVPGEYFILENRQQEGVFDSALPGHGLIIYHANDQKIADAVVENTLNATYPQAMYTVCANAKADPSTATSSYGSVNTAGASFPGSGNVATFSDQTLPSTKSINGRLSYRKLTDISENNGLISFNFVQEEMPDAPIDLTATAERGIVELKWNMPDDAEEVAYFTVYRNDESIGTTTDKFFTDENAIGMTVIGYSVDATYTDGRISPFTSVTIRVPANKVEEINYAVENKQVALEWNLEKRITRMEDDTKYYVCEQKASSLDYAHRFTKDDLAIYKGYKIRRIGFLPYQTAQEVTYTIRVWEAEEGGINPVLVSERLVKEYGAYIWNATLLTKTVEITGDKEIWVGLHCESNNGNVQILTDQGSLLAGYGNWIKKDNGDWEADANAEGNYFLYAELTEPAVGEPAEVAEYAGPIDPGFDLFFPIGFAVYRDGTLLGTSGSRSFVDNAPMAGTHTYAVASLYKGGNESISLPVEVFVSEENGNVESISEDMVRIVVGNGTVSLPAYDGMLSIADISGRLVYQGTYVAGTEIGLGRGVFILKTDKQVRKIIMP